ncbi:MAG: KpsF/GutQ family sugar-phosphate isomerase [Rikenellaceae bacterium]|nr:KpsF/GutQ family sugar-phosphate isomerase [Rikenellaceae bacterium]
MKEFARGVISTEAEAVARLVDFVDDSFADIASSIISSERGRIIVTGIGKSAIIGMKIVATLNSTGSPAVFMHAADAIHGDLGVIQNYDTIICISKSGNTPEIKGLIPLIRSLGRGNVIIGMVGSQDSFLASASDYVINTHVTKEACPNNLAPTSSTTAQLVMGDALAMTLLKMRGFSAADFAKVHPGGALGKRLYVRVEDLLASHAEAPCVAHDAPIDDVIIEISSKMVGATAVVDASGRLVGVITDGDLRRMLQRKVDISRLTASDIMTRSPKTVARGELAVKAFAIMEEKKITQLLVIDDNGSYCGIVHIHDILREGVV